MYSPLALQLFTKNRRVIKDAEGTEPSNSPKVYYRATSQLIKYSDAITTLILKGHDKLDEIKETLDQLNAPAEQTALVEKCRTALKRKLDRATQAIDLAKSDMMPTKADIETIKVIYNKLFDYVELQDNELSTLREKLSLLNASKEKLPAVLKETEDDDIVVIKTSSFTPR